MALADELLLEAEPGPVPQPAPAPLSAQPAPAFEDFTLRRVPAGGASGEEMFGDPGQAEEILDLFI